MKLATLFIATLWAARTFSQLQASDKLFIDSLSKTIKTAKHDSIVINAWIAWDDLIWQYDPDLDLDLNIKIKNKCSFNLDKNLKKSEQEFFKKNFAKALHNLGSIFYSKGDYAKAISYFTQSLKIKEELNDIQGIAATVNNIGNIYLDQTNYEKAKKYYLRSLEISKKLKDKYSMASALSNIGLIYSGQGDFDKALEYQNRSLNLRKEVDDKKGIAVCLSNIGLIYSNLEEYNKALEYYKQGLDIFTELDDKQGIATSQSDFGNTYFKLGDYKKAIEYGNKSLKIAKDRGVIAQEKYAYSVLYQSYEAIKNYEKAFEMYQHFIEIKDSLASEENQKEILRQEYQYAYEKRVAEDSVKAAVADKIRNAELMAERAENLQHTLEAKQQRQRSYFLFGFLALALIFGGFIFNRFRVANKQKLIIEEQKLQVDKAFDDLENKNTEILDSINYAKRIQNAILPSNVLVKEYLKESFIFYKPKDIVAGDFYWLEIKDNKTLFAAADCTGHGVPGAMVSVICNNGLNRSVREHGLTIPGEILDKTREIVLQEFDKSEDDVNDGMDISLCALEGNKLQFAGANNPLWIIRNGELIEYKADKQPIGKSDHPVPFRTHTIELLPNDTIYVFSDGYADQFGGENNRKFKSVAFKTLLLSIQQLSMSEQMKHIDKIFEEWKGNLDQVDDICIIGVRFMG